MHGAEATDQPRASKSGEEESSLNRGSREPGKSGGNDPDSPQPQVLGRAEAEKRIKLQNRVYKAPLIIPKYIPFRVFELEDLRACVEAEEILKQLVLPS